MRRLQIGLGIFALSALVLSLVAVQTRWNRELFTLAPTMGALLLSVLSAAVSLLGMGAVLRLTNYKKTVQQILIGLGMATVGFLFARPAPVRV